MLLNVISTLIRLQPEIIIAKLSQSRKISSSSPFITTQANIPSEKALGQTVASLDTQAFYSYAKYRRCSLSEYLFGGFHVEQTLSSNGNQDEKGDVAKYDKRQFIAYLRTPAWLINKV